MIDGNLDTTNLLLGIMAAVSVLEALLLVAVGIMAWRLYAQTMRTVKELEQRQIAPLMTKVNGLMVTVDGILHDVKGVTTRVTHQTERVDTAIRTTIDRVDETADRVRVSVSGRLHRMIGLVQGVRAAVGTLFDGHDRRRSAAART